MAAAEKPIEARFLAAAGVKAQYKSFVRDWPDIRSTNQTFNEYKREIPAKRLPAAMKDHALKGAFKGIRECHLADDVLLLYTHRKNEVRMLYICEHADLYGRRGKKLATEVWTLDAGLK